MARLVVRVQQSGFSSQELTLRTQLFINNEWVDAKSKKTFDTINPADETKIATVQEAGKEDIDYAVAAAWAACLLGRRWILRNAAICCSSLRASS